MIEAQVNKLKMSSPLCGPEEISAFASAGFWCCGLRPDSRAAWTEAAATSHSRLGICTRRCAYEAGLADQLEPVWGAAVEP